MISVVIPLYNKAPHIGRALASVLTQTRLPGEIIVVNDGSTDGGEEIVRQYQGGGVHLLSQRNTGVSSARNRGIQEAHYPFVAFLDADDAWKPGFLETIWQLREHYPKAGAFATAFESVSTRKERIPHPKALALNMEHGLIEDFYGQAYSFAMTICAVMVSKAVLEEVGGFATREAYGKEVDVDILEDADLLLKIALRYPIAYSNQIQATIYQDAVNRACLTKRRTGEPALSFTARQAFETGLVKPESGQALQEYAAFHQLAAARDLLLEGNRDLALTLLAHAKASTRYTHWWWKVRAFSFLPKLVRNFVWRTYKNRQLRKNKMDTSIC